jgi:hypothetical protein
MAVRHCTFRCLRRSCLCGVGLDRGFGYWLSARWFCRWIPTADNYTHAKLFVLLLLCQWLNGFVVLSTPAVGTPLEF